MVYSHDMECRNKFPEVLEARKKYQVCLDEDFEVLSYVPVDPILQQGPQCGLVALGMYLKSQNLLTTIEDIFNIAKSLGYTLNGEMFSTDNLTSLAQNYLGSNSAQTFDGYISDLTCIQHLTQNGVILAPYDADANHSPCSRKGHKAHWCLINGLLSSNNKYYVSARHGKSKHLAIWGLEELAISNSQLNEFSPDRKATYVEYVLPGGGIGGSHGLKNKCVLLKLK